MRRQSDPLFSTLGLIALILILFSGFNTRFTREIRQCVRCLSPNIFKKTEYRLFDFAFLTKQELTKQAESSLANFANSHSKACAHDFHEIQIERVTSKPLVGVVLEENFDETPKLTIDQIRFRELSDQVAQGSGPELLRNHLLEYFSLNCSFSNLNDCKIYQLWLNRGLLQEFENLCKRKLNPCPQFNEYVKQKL